MDSFLAFSRKRISASAGVIPLWGGSRPEHIMFTERTPMLPLCVCVRVGVCVCVHFEHFFFFLAAELA